MKKTILHISKYYYPDLGGIETLVRSLAEGLTDYRNVVVCFATNGKTSETTINGVIVHRVKVNFSFMHQDVSFGYFKILKNLVQKYSPDFVHVHCPNPYVYPLVLRAILPDTKLILHWHSDIISKGLMYKVVKPFENKALKRSDLILATSPNYIHPSSPIYQYKEKIRIVQNGVIAADFDMKEGDEERIKSIKQQFDNKPLVIFVGRHIQYKGIDLLIEIEKYIQNDCHVIITGTGPLTNKLEKQSVSPRITFTGRLSSDDLRCYVHAADIFAFPSNTKAEAFGIALAEAMYCRCVPVVFHLEGSGVNWVSLKDQTGMEIPHGDIKAFAAAIDQLLNNRSLLDQYALASHERVKEHFTDEMAVRKMNEIYSIL